MPTEDASPGHEIDYENADDWNDVSRPELVFAPAHLEEWDIATNELREQLAHLENIDWTSWEDVAEAEEIIDNRLPEIQGDLHDAFDSVRRAEDV